MLSEDLVMHKINEILERMKGLNNKEYFVLKLNVSDPQYENYVFALLRLFSLENSEEIIPITDLKPFDVLKRIIDGHAYYLLSDSFNDVHIILRDDEEEVEKNLKNIEMEFFDNLKEILKLDDCKIGQLVYDVDDIKVYFLSLNEEDIKEKEEMINFHGEKIKVKIGKKGLYIYAKIQNSEYLKIYYHSLDRYKKV